MKYKVAIVGPEEWSLANINYFLKKHLPDNIFDVNIVYWTDVEWYNKTKDHDLIITEISMFNHIIDNRYKDKTIGILHHFPALDGLTLNGHFASTVSEENMGDGFCITQKIKEVADDFYNRDFSVLPIGVDVDFWSKRDVKSIKTIGSVLVDNQNLNNNSLDYVKIKRPSFFQKIAEKSKLKSKLLNGKSFQCGSYIYKDIDCLICTSVEEGNPMGLLECAAAKIPYISTKCGLAHEYDFIKTFETVDEAVEIINDFNRNPKKLTEYIEIMYENIALERNWPDIIKKYWTPQMLKFVKKWQTTYATA